MARPVPWWAASRHESSGRTSPGTHDHAPSLHSLSLLRNEGGLRSRNRPARDHGHAHVVGWNAGPYFPGWHNHGHVRPNPGRRGGRFLKFEGPPRCIAWRPLACNLCAARLLLAQVIGGDVKVGHPGTELLERRLDIGLVHLRHRVLDTLLVLGDTGLALRDAGLEGLSLIHISEPTRLGMISY